MRKVFGIALIIGIMLFLIGTQTDSGEEVRTYHKVYKDSNGVWQGKDVSYLAPSTSSTETIGFVFAIVGGIGLAFTKKKDNINNNETTTNITASKKEDS